MDIITENKSSVFVEKLLPGNKILHDYLETSAGFYKNLGVGFNLMKARYFAEGQILSAEIVFGTEHCAYKDIIHGGKITAALDSIVGVNALIGANFKQNRIVVTQNMDIVFHQKVTPGTTMILESQIDPKTKSKIACYGRLRDALDKNIVHASCWAALVSISVADR